MLHEVEDFVAEVQRINDIAVGTTCSMTAVLVPHLLQLDSAASVISSVAAALASQDRDGGIVNAPQRHAMSIVVSTGGSLADSNACMWVGVVDFEALKAASGAAATPWAVQLRLLFTAVRTAQFAVGPIASPPTAASASLTSAALLTASEAVLVASCKGPIAMQWTVPLQRYAAGAPMRCEALRGRIVSLITAAHALQANALDAERRLREDAESTVARLQAAAAVGGADLHLVDAAVREAPGARHHNALRPRSLLNPAQAPNTKKRGRGVKIG
jgi:hypothetical protein